MAVSLLLPPETVWGYDTVTSAYSETPYESWERLTGRIRSLYPDADQKEIEKLIGKAPDVAPDVS